MRFRNPYSLSVRQVIARNSWLIILGITDGTPAGENKDEIFSVIIRTDQELKRTRYGPDAISYRQYMI